MGERVLHTDRLDIYAAENLDLYELKLPETSQCSGWFILKYLVENKVDINQVEVSGLHPNLLTFLRENWDTIKELKI